MKKMLFSFLLLSSMGLSAQVTIFEDGFELYDNFIITNIGSWKQIDVDEAPTYGIEVGTPPNTTPVQYQNSGYTGSFIIFNKSATNPVVDDAWAAKTGNKVIACFNALVNPQLPKKGPNNDWLISPQLQLGGSGNTLTFWAKSAASNYPNERFKVGVSTTGTAVGDFTVISTGEYVQTTATWTQYTYNLDAYAGQAVYLSINCISNDQFALLIDDYKVTATTLSTDNFLVDNFSIYPNPTNGIVNIIGKNNAAINSIQITDVNGRIIKNLDMKDVQETQIDITDLTAGMYFLNIQTDLGSGASKIIKK